MKKLITILLTVAMMALATLPAFAYVDPSVTTMGVSYIGIPILLIVVIVVVILIVLKKKNKKNKKYNNDDW